MQFSRARFSFRLLRHRYAALLVVDQLCGAAGMQSLDCSRRARTVRAGSDEAGFGLDCDGEPAPEDANPRRGASSEPSACKRHPSNEDARSEEHTSELQSLMRISYAVFCLKKKNHRKQIDRANKQYRTKTTSPQKINHIHSKDHTNTSPNNL